MGTISYARYFIVIIYLCKSRTTEDIRVVSATADDSAAVTAGRGDIRSIQTNSVSSPTADSASPRSSAFTDTTDDFAENTVTYPTSYTDTFDNASRPDVDCEGDNNTRRCPHTPTGPASPHVDPLIITVINRVQLVMTCTGFFANAATFLTLTNNGARFSPLIRLLIKHQSLVDLGACAMGTLYLILPSMHWRTGHWITDFFICYAWHSQGLYWADVFVSIWNLVLIGVERYIMICKPFLYSSVTRKHFFYTFAGIYAGSFVCLIPAYMQVSFVQDDCLPEHYFKGNFGHYLYYGYSFFTLFVFYLLPVGAFVFIYGRILVAFRKRLKSTACSSILDEANNRMTKTGVAVTVIFVLTIGYDIIYYSLGKTGVAVYVINSPVQKIGLLLSAFNSVANPFVYVLLMPAFRESLRKTFHLPPWCGMAGSKNVTDSSNTGTSGSDMVTAGAGPTTDDTNENITSVTASPNNVQVEMTPVTQKA